MPLPTVETERLVLRRPRLDDFEDQLAMWSDPTVVRFIGGKPTTREDMWSRLLRYVGHWELLGYGFWVVREKGTERFVGEVGVADFKRDMTPSLGSAKEVGWALSPAVHGKGYATEAVRAALAWADERLGAERRVCLIHPDNAASLNVARKVGFREFARGTYKGEQSIVFERVPSASP